MVCSTKNEVNKINWLKYVEEGGVDFIVCNLIGVNDGKHSTSFTQKHNQG